MPRRAPQKVALRTQKRRTAFPKTPHRIPQNISSRLMASRCWFSQPLYQWFLLYHRYTFAVPPPYLRRCTLGFHREIRGCSGAGRAMVRRRWGVVFPLPAGESQNSGCSPQLLVARGRFGGNSLVRVAGGFFSRSRCVYARVSQRVRAENSPELWGTGRAPTAWEAAQPQRM